MHVVIVGAGPAGLATAAELAERGIAFTILERGGTALAALGELDPEMQLLTPTRFSRIADMAPREGEPEYLRFGELVAALEAWRAERGIEVVTGATVRGVERGFVVRYARAADQENEIAASHVVNATGIIGQPRVPDAIGFAGRWRHSAAVRTADLEAARRLLVVGAGMSAAEVIERWLDVRRPGDRAWLSARGRVQAVPAKLFGLDIHWFLLAADRLPGRIAGRRIGPGRDLIIGRRLLAALRDGSVARVPAVAAYERDAVQLAGGTRLEPDLVVFATGFRYGASHLGSLVERDRDGWPIVDRHSASTVTPDLYVLGARFGRTTASARLAGIARDARHVGARIARARA